MALSKGSMRRASVVQSILNRSEKQLLAQAKKEGKTDAEIKAMRSQVVPNRTDLRNRQIGTARGLNTPFSRRRSGAKALPASLYRLKAFRQVRADGTSRTIVIPIEMVEEPKNAE
jgi:hypothetical protein